MGTDTVISLAGVAVSLVGAWLIAKKYGDVAGTLAARRFQEEDAKRARVAAFQSLINEVVRIREVAKHYQSPSFDTASGAPKLPVTAFETAFVSGSPGLAAREELVKAVSEYLVFADSINWLIDKHLIGGGNLGDFAIRQDWTRLSEVLNRLNDCLERELES
jgi:hypothetical protein